MTEEQDKWLDRLLLEPIQLNSRSKRLENLFHIVFKCFLKSFSKLLILYKQAHKQFIHTKKLGIGLHWNKLQTMLITWPKMLELKTGSRTYSSYHGFRKSPIMLLLRSKEIFIRIQTENRKIKALRWKNLQCRDLWFFRYLSIAHL